jgi:hypothetical protein
MAFGIGMKRYQTHTLPATPHMSVQPDSSLMGETYPVAALICLCGLLLRLALNNSIMQTLGLSDGDPGTAGTMNKLNPGTYLICLSFFALLAGSTSPIHQLMRVLRECTAFCLLLAFYALFFIYWALRDPSGVGMVLETHMSAPICAIVFSYAPRSYCRRAVGFFLCFMTLNSLAGIAESIGKFRILSFQADWMTEALFRPSAFLGHPLANALYTTLALFVMLATELPVWVKTLLLVLYMTTLVAFGERSAFAITLIGLVPLGLMAIKRAIAGRRLTLARMFLLCAAALVIPAALTGGLYLIVGSGLGERLSSLLSMQDDSADARWVAFKALNYLSPSEMMLGVSTLRTVEIVDRLNFILPMADIENPWLLMLLYMGVIFFSLWLVLLTVYIVSLMRESPAALKMSIVMYMVIASTSNSFGRKDNIFALLPALVICTKSFIADRNRKKN